MKKKTVKIPIYFGDLIIMQVKNWDKINKKFGFNVGNDNVGIAFSRTTKKGKSKYYFCSVRKYDLEIAVHESVHLCNYIFKDRGIDLDLINDEPQAYLTGWIFKQINNFYKELNKK